MGGESGRNITIGLDLCKRMATNGKKVNIISMSLSGGANQITITEKRNLEIY